MSNEKLQPEKVNTEIFEVKETSAGYAFCPYPARPKPLRFEATRMPRTVLSVVRWDGRPVMTMNIPG